MNSVGTAGHTPFRVFTEEVAYVSLVALALDSLQLRRWTFPAAHDTGIAEHTVTEEVASV